MTDKKIPTNLTELANRLNTKATAMQNGVAPEGPQITDVHDPLHSRDVGKVRALFQKVKDVKDAVMYAPAEQIDAEMTMSTMYKEVKNSPLSFGQKRELGRDIDVYRAAHGDLEAKLSVLIYKFEDAKFVAIKREEYDAKKDALVASGAPVPEGLQKAISEGPMRASATMEDLKAVLPAANLLKEREKFVNFGKPDQKEKELRGQMFDEAMAEIKQYGKDIGREAEINKALEPDKKTSAIKQEGINPIAVRSGMPETNKFLA